MSSALIVVDIQNDFCEGGSLPVEGGERVAKKVALYVANTSNLYDRIVYTKDWHNPPPDSNGGHFGTPPDFVNTWPVHCVSDTEGAEFHPVILDMMRETQNPNQKAVFYKGVGTPDYSGFQGYNEDEVDLNTYLSQGHILNVDVVGLAGDYCVKETALDAVRFGFVTNILTGFVASVGGNAATDEAWAAVDRLGGGGQQ